MANFKICVFRTQKRKDDKYPVWIRVYWQGKKSYIRTEFNATIHQIYQKKNSFELKDVFVINKLNERIAIFEREKLNIDIREYTAKQLAKRFSEIGKNDTLPDFLQFGYDLCEQRKKEGWRVMWKWIILIVLAILLGPWVLEIVAWLFEAIAWVLRLIAGILGIFGSTGIKFSGMVEGVI